MNLSKADNKIYNKYYKLYKKKNIYMMKNQYINMKKKLLLLINKKYNLSIKKKIGIILNYFKIFKKKNNILKNNNIDLTINNIYLLKGNLHPLTILINKLLNLFKKLNFNIIETKEIINKYKNFYVLNIKKHHSVLSSKDTFFFNNKNKLLRTHITSFYCDYLKKNNPPFKVINYGKVYRNETITNKSNYMFFQLDGLCIDKNISYSKFFNIIIFLIKRIFKNLPYRIRYSYFPFTIFSLEIDIFHFNKWIEVFGGGMLNKKILNNFKINSIYNGYAFGLGIDRILMILLNIFNIRNFYKNNLLFLKNFKNLF
ncbi:MAG: phenylalanine--tRNA ligase subunit alpha [Candidatus Shikimatogenerans sp. AspAUS03]|uniref:Phenylalanine--tRNA ligase subunit alpha n=1 Tax=Candidatus Shikimatogenerans sp. AspAUS03 TaxID=3158563 RepID=A0AAU7QV45_9FLAO